MLASLFLSACRILVSVSTALSILLRRDFAEYMYRTQTINLALTIKHLRVIIICCNFLYTNWISEMLYASQRCSLCSHRTSLTLVSVSTAWTAQQLSISFAQMPTVEHLVVKLVLRPSSYSKLFSQTQMLKGKHLCLSDGLRSIYIEAV